MNSWKKLWKALSTVIVVFTAVIGAVSAFFYIFAFIKKIPDWIGSLVFGEQKPDPDWDRRNAMEKETEEWLKTQDKADMYVTSFDGLRLYGQMVWAKNDLKRTAILMHGFRGRPEGDFAGIMQHYHEAGWNVLLVNDRAHGKSEGKWLGFSWLDRRDLVTWAKMLANIFGKDAKIILHGVSMGGAGVMMASGEEDLPEEVKAVIEDCGFTSTLDQFRHSFPKGLAFLREPVLFTDSIFSRIFRGYTFQEASSLKQLRKNTRPMLFIHGGSDDFVPTEMVYKNYDACNAPKELYIASGAAHAVSYAHDPEGYIGAMDAFLEKYVTES